MPLSRCKPRRLRDQVLLLLAVVTAVAMALLYVVSTLRLNETADVDARQWAQSLARTAANAGATRLAGNDLRGLESSLRDFALLPGVRRIEWRDRDGQAVLALTVTEDQRVLADRPDPAMPAAPPPPADDDSDAGRVLAWAPMGAGGDLGSVGVHFALDAQRQHIQQLRHDTVLAVALVGLCSLLAMHTLLGRALAPLQRVVSFSRGLGRGSGQQLQPRDDSQEILELTEALNDAARTLQGQLDAIRASEMRLHVMVNAVPDAIIGVDEQGLIRSASPAATNIFGREPADLVGVPLAELLPGIDAADAERRTLEGLYMRNSRTHVARFDASARRHGGTVFPVEVSLARLDDADIAALGEGATRYACAVRDVTDQRTMDSMLRLYGRALECTSNGVVIADMSLPHAPVIYANQAFSAITGYEVADTIGRNCAFLQRGDVAQHELQLLREAIAEGRTATVVLRNYRADGTLFFNELSVAPVVGEGLRPTHYVGVLNDVTERERARLAIAERNARLNAVFDLSPDGFVVFDREGQLVYSNQAFLAMTGWDGSQLAEGLSMADFDRRFARLCDPDRPAAPLLDREGDTASPAVQLLHLRQPRDRVLSRLVRHNAGGQGESVLYFRDVTHETEVDRMKSEFLTTAAHELRTPMVSVFGFTELLLNRPVPEARRRDVLETIHRQASLLIHMVNELLDLARIEARQGKDLHREPCPLGPLVRQALAGFSAPPDGERLRVALAHEHERLLVDAEKTHRALTNVVSNAFKYSPQGGAIEVCTIAGEVQGQRAIGLRVRDHGIGMTPAQLARVCERFYRADPSGNIPGTGLGMSLVKEIVELQGGAITLESQPGQGTEVTLWLPCAATTTASLPAPAAAPSTP